LNATHAVSRRPVLKTFFDPRKEDEISQHDSECE